MPITTAAAPPAGLRTLDASSVTRTEVVRPAMCGHNTLLVGQIGDWTWDAVSALCGTDVLRARDPSGAPTYLSFYYYRIRGSQRFHLRTPSFGDRLHVTSRLFDFGSESVLALHRIARTPAGEADHAAHAAAAFAAAFDPDEFYAFGDERCLYVENFNRWITRSDERSNQALVRSSPVGFQHRHLPALPEGYSPRRACQRARTQLTFRDGDRDGDGDGDRDGRHVPAGPALRAEYPIDPTRDLNGVGLLYFAAYFAIVDWALLRLWRRLGRSDQSFLQRVVTDQQLCYLGNADAGCVVVAAAQRWQVAGDDTRELVDVVLRDRDTGRLLAVCTLQLEGGGSR